VKITQRFGMFVSQSSRRTGRALRHFADALECVVTSGKKVGSQSRTTVKETDETRAALDETSQGRVDRIKVN
jgi:hypothetical protein